MPTRPEPSASVSPVMKLLLLADTCELLAVAALTTSASPVTRPLSAVLLAMLVVPSYTLLALTLKALRAIVTWLTPAAACVRSGN